MKTTSSRQCISLKKVVIHFYAYEYRLFRKFFAKAHGFSDDISQWNADEMQAALFCQILGGTSSHVWIPYSEFIKYCDGQETEPTMKALRRFAELLDNWQDSRDSASSSQDESPPIRCEANRRTAVNRESSQGADDLRTDALLQASLAAAPKPETAAKPQ
jgi:hypothetical protein